MMLPKYLSLFSIAVINTKTKSNVGRKEFICLTFSHHNSSLTEARADAHGRNLGTRAEAESGGVMFTGLLYIPASRWYYPHCRVVSYFPY